jgi:hypothetical protein
VRTIRGGKGIGDALYVQSVARYFVARGERLTVCTSWPDVFRPLGTAVAFEPFRRDRIDILAHYSLRKGQPTRQWQDVCIQAGVREPVELRLDWRPSSDLGDRVRRMAMGRPIVAVQLPRVPMARRDAFGAELLPDCRTLQRLIDALKGRALIVQIGAGRPLFTFRGIEVDLANLTTVCELFDVAREVDAFLGYVSFVVPLAESLDKRALLVWSRAGLKAAPLYVRQITPAKILEKPTSRFVFDDASDRQLSDAANELL